MEKRGILAPGLAGVCDVICAFIRGIYRLGKVNERGPWGGDDALLAMSYRIRPQSPPERCRSLLLGSLGRVPFGGLRVIIDSGSCMVGAGCICVVCMGLDASGICSTSREYDSA